MTSRMEVLSQRSEETGKKEAFAKESAEEMRRAIIAREMVRTLRETEMGIEYGCFAAENCGVPFAK